MAGLGESACGSPAQTGSYRPSSSRCSESTAAHDPTEERHQPALRRVSREQRGNACAHGRAPREGHPDQAGRRRDGAAKAPEPRQAAAARAGPHSARRRLAVPRALPARGLGHVRQRGAGRRPDHRYRPRVRPRVHDRRERRDGEGRHLLPGHRQEAPARPGDRPREPPAVPLSGRLGRRQPAEPGRGLSRPRALRADLLQPGHHVGRGHPADRRGDGLVHGRRRLRAGDVGRGDHRAQSGDDLPRRAAPGEGGDRRGGDGRGARRRRHAHADLRRRRSLRGERRPRPGDRPAHRRRPQHGQAARPRGGRATREPNLRPG